MTLTRCLAAVAPAAPAVQNAAVDAVAHLGVRHIDIPTTPDHVWRAIEAATHDSDTTIGHHDRTPRSSDRTDGVVA